MTVSPSINHQAKTFHPNTLPKRRVTSPKKALLQSGKQSSPERRPFASTLKQTAPSQAAFDTAVNPLARLVQNKREKLDQEKTRYSMSAAVRREMR
jgi:hypothetical protein